MSNAQNDNLLEEAASYIDEFEDKLPARMLEADIAAGDMESLQQHVTEARELSFQLNYNPDFAS